MTKENWNPESKTWNVKEAEEDILSVLRWAKFFRNGVAPETLLNVFYRNSPEYKECLKNAAREMASIVYEKNNSIGYHINHITSGTFSYYVYSIDNLRIYCHHKTCGSKEEAEKEAAAFKDAYAEEHDGKWYVYVFDEERTQEELNNNCFGEFMGKFDSYEEAKKERESYKHAYIRKLPSEEWWVVIKDDIHRNAYNIIFPTEIRAIAFMYRAAQPKAWMELVEKFGKVA